jgi:phenylacetate-CoA ligase
MSTMTTSKAKATTTVTAGELLTHDGWSRDELLRYQRDRLHDLLEHAVGGSPYYRALLGRDALAADIRLEDLPTLPKATLVEQFDRVLADPRLRLAAVESHATGPDPGGLMSGALQAGAYHVFSTSGTSGRRGMFPQTPAEFDRWVAAAGRLTARIGLPAEARTIGIAAPTPLHITQKLFHALGGWGGARPRLTVTMPLPELVAALSDDQPEALFTVPGLLGMLALEQLEGRLNIQLRWAVVSGEVLTQETVMRVRQAWGIDPVEVYATTEALFLAGPVPGCPGLQINEDLVVLEVVDEHDRPVPPGIPGHKVLLTSLVSRTLPLIRYEVADAVTLAGGPNPAGLPYQRIERVDGRNDDLLRLPGAGGGEVIVLPHRLRAPFAQLADVTQYQVVREPDRIAVRVVLRPDAAADTPGRVRSGIVQALREAGAALPPIEVEQVDGIEREPGGAKLKLVKTIGSAGGRP